VALMFVLQTCRDFINGFPDKQFIIIDFRHCKSCSFPDNAGGMKLRLTFID
jgi:hypothetical protein